MIFCKNRILLISPPPTVTVVAAELSQYCAASLLYCTMCCISAVIVIILIILITIVMKIICVIIMAIICAASLLYCIMCCISAVIVSTNHHHHELHFSILLPLLTNNSNCPLYFPLWLVITNCTLLYTTQCILPPPLPPQVGSKSERLQLHQRNFPASTSNHPSRSIRSSSSSFIIHDNLLNIN